MNNFLPRTQSSAVTAKKGIWDGPNATMDYSSTPIKVENQVFRSKQATLPNKGVPPQVENPQRFTYHDPFPQKLTNDS